jgi:hypothetical protein
VIVPEQHKISDEKSRERREMLAAFFVEVEQLSAQVFARTGETTLDCRIAGQAVRFQGAGNAMLDVLTAAFAHLASHAKADNMDLTVLLWDSASTGVRMARPLWDNADYTLRGDIRSLDDPRYRIAFHVPSRVLSLLDMERGLAVCWANDARDIPSYVRGMPLLPIVHWWMAARGIQLLHGGLVGTRHGGVLLAGKGKAGKSNTALSCLAHPELFYLSDDYCLVRLGEQPRGHSLYCTGRLHPWDLPNLPFLRPALVNPHALATDKALFVLYPHFSGKFATDLPLRAIFMPRVGEYPAIRLEKSHTAEAHRALTTVTLHHLPGAGAATIQNISSLVRSLPCYYLNLGKDRGAIPQAIVDFLSTSL